MTLLVVGTDGPIAQALCDGVPPAHHDEIVKAITNQQPTELVILALAAPTGPVGALPTEHFAAVLAATVTTAFVSAKAAAGLLHPVRIVVVCPADGVRPDHAEGARSVAAAGLTMLTEVCSAARGLTMNTIAVAETVPTSEVITAVRFALADATPSLNGAVIRLDGGRAAVLAPDE